MLADLRHTEPVGQACPATARGATTRAAHRQAVEQVIGMMSVRVDAPLSLQDMAAIARLSPFHFTRVFRDITGVPPQKFQATLRMEMAKRLLLTTRLSVLDVCFEVGYSSPGTFTTHFTRYVGVPPRHLRRMAEREAAVALPPMMAPSGGSQQGVSGVIGAPAQFSGPLFIGLFPDPMPQGRPVGCVAVPGPGPYTMAGVPDASYYVCAAAIEPDADPLTYLLPGADTLYVGVSSEPVVVRHGQADRAVDLTLRRAERTDPPLLMAFPCFFAEPDCPEGASDASL